MKSPGSSSVTTVTLGPYQQVITSDGELALYRKEIFDDGYSETWCLERVNRVSSDPNPEPPTSGERRGAQQRTRAALSKLKRRFSLPALDASFRRFLHFLAPKPDWGKGRAEDPCQYRRQEESVEHYLSLTDAYWSTLNHEDTFIRVESLPVPKTQPLTASWLKTTIRDCDCLLLKRELQPASSAQVEASPPSLDKALPDSEIFRRLALLHDEQKKLELEILLRDLLGLRIAAESSSCGARHISAQQEELDRIPGSLPRLRESKCVAEKCEEDDE